MVVKSFLKMLEAKFQSLLDIIHARSVIVKLQACASGHVKLSVGRMSKGGSYTGAYDANPAIPAHVQVEMMEHLLDIFEKFREKNPRNRTLFFRYNASKGLEIFKASSMILTSKITGLLDDA